MPEPGGDAPDPLRELRRHYEGVLLFDGHATPVRFIIDDATGVLVLAVEPVVLTAAEHILFVPEERDSAVELMLELSAADPTAGDLALACDRWAAYHGRTTLRAWAAAAVGAAKWNGRVHEGDAIMRPNPLRHHRSALLPEVGTDPALLGAACKRLAGLDVADPAVVGIDPWGVDVRARFGIVRLEFQEEAPTSDAALAAITRLLRGGLRP